MADAAATEETEVLDIGDLDAEAFTELAIEQGWSDGPPRRRRYGLTWRRRGLFGTAAAWSIEHCYATAWRGLHLLDRVAHDPHEVSKIAARAIPTPAAARDTRSVPPGR